MLDPSIEKDVVEFLDLYSDKSFCLYLANDCSEEEYNESLREKTKFYHYKWGDPRLN